METLLTRLLALGPVFFGFLLFAPMLNGGLVTLGYTQVCGLPSLTASLVVGGSWGVIALLRGRWL